MKILKNTYRISPFTIYPLNDDSWVLQTTTQLNIIKNIILVQTLKSIYGKKYITEFDLNNIISQKNMSAKIIDYLKKNKIITSLKNLNFDLREKVLFTNNKKYIHFLIQTILIKLVFSKRQTILNWEIIN